MSGAEEYFQPPFSVFFLWAIFLGIIILFHPIRSVVKRIFRCFGCSWCAETTVDDDNDERESEGDRHGDYWNHLSSDRKLEIDNLRAVAILKYLAKFTLTLNGENMTSYGSKECEVAVESIQETPQSETDEKRCDITDVSTKEEDIEQGFPNETHNSLHDEAKVEILECSSEYTHILVPFPGHTRGEEDNEDDINNKNTEPAKTSWHPSLPKFKVPQDKPSCAKDTAENKDSNDVERAVPIFCAVCLMEYEVSDRVCWSSNKECTHVFHEDCIVQWFVSSGRTKSKRRWFPDNPSERRLMCYELECPCCRQEFISKEARVDNAEENA